jgi:carboxypeptidase C (cathepsin A)
MSIDTQYNEFKVFERTGERFLDIVNNMEDKFIYTLTQIDWGLRSTTYLSDIVTQYYSYDFSKLNAYAVVLGDMCLDDYVNIDLKLFKNAVSMLKKKVDYRNILLDELIDKSDIIRYATLMKNLRQKASSQGVTVNQYKEEEYNEDGYKEDQNYYDDDDDEYRGDYNDEMSDY